MATIAANGALYGCSDRMLTLGIRESEPDSPKIYHAEDRPFSIMWAGSAAVHSELFDSFGLAIAEVERQKGGIPTTQEVVQTYCECYEKMRATHAEAAILRPLGLTHMDLIANEEMIEDVRQDLMDRVMEFEMLPHQVYDVEAIFLGVDSGGPHLWTFYNGAKFCRDIEGYAAIGAGAEVALAQLQGSRFTRSVPPRETAFLTYLAKKRAEVIAGVGKETDMFMRAPLSRTKHIMPQDWIAAFDSIYADLQAGEIRALVSAVERTRTFFDAITQQVAKAAAEAGLGPPPASTHGQ